MYEHKHKIHSFKKKLQQEIVKRETIICHKFEECNELFFKPGFI